MQETTNNLTWIILGLLAAAVVMTVVLKEFPTLTSNITTFLSNTVTSAGDKITSSISGAASAVTTTTKSVA